MGEERERGVGEERERERGGEGKREKTLQWTRHQCSVSVHMLFAPMHTNWTSCSKVLYSTFVIIRLSISIDIVIIYYKWASDEGEKTWPQGFKTIFMLPFIYFKLYVLFDCIDP